MGNDVHLLDKWYRKDTNKTPPESILLPITTHLVHFLNKRQPKLQARDAGIWWGTLGKLQLMLRKAAKVRKYILRNRCVFDCIELPARVFR